MPQSIIHAIHSIDPGHGGTTEAVRLLAWMHGSVSSTVLSADDPVSGLGADWPCQTRLLGPARTKFGWTSNWGRGLQDLLVPGAVLVIHGLWQYHVYAAARAARSAGVPYLIFPHGMLDLWALQQSRWLKQMAWCLYNCRVFQQASGVCFTTEDERRLAAPKLKKIPGRQLIVPLGVEGPPEAPDILKAEFFKDHPALAGRRVFLFLGRLHPKKGCDMLLKAFAGWQAAHDPGRLAHLRLAGPPHDPAYQAELERLCQSLGLKIGPDVSFAGTVAGRDKWRELSAAEVLVLPSHQENFGLVVAEALACSVPVLLSDKVNTAPFIAEHGAGVVADDTVEGTFRLLQEWSFKTAESQALARLQACQLFQQRFGVESSRRRFLDVVHEVADESAR